jgi:hypothetical protein
MRLKVVFLGLSAVCLANPAAAASGFVVLHAPHGFAMAPAPHPGGHGDMRPRGYHPYGQAYGGVALDTLPTGTFDSAPDVYPDSLPPPYPPPGYYPAYYQPPPHPCFRPLVIDLVPPEKPAGKLPRVIYGTKPPDCPE